jgi:hypothetical protein
MENTSEIERICNWFLTKFRPYTGHLFKQVLTYFQQKKQQKRWHCGSDDDAPRSVSCHVSVRTHRAHTVLPNEAEITHGAQNAAMVRCALLINRASDAVLALAQKELVGGQVWPKPPNRRGYRAQGEISHAAVGSILQTRYAHELGTARVTVERSLAHTRRWLGASKNLVGRGSFRARRTVCD